MDKPRARSRLEKISEKKEIVLSVEKKEKHKPNKQPKIYIPLKKYLRHSPTLFLAIPFYWITYSILTTVFPNQIENFLITKSYLPLQIPLYLGNFFFFSFLTLKTRRGFLISLFIGLILFLRLQNVTLDWIVVGIILSGFLTLEIIVKIFFERDKNN